MGFASAVAGHRRPCMGVDKVAARDAQNAKKSESEIGVTGTQSDDARGFSADTGATKACH